MTIANPAACAADSRSTAFCLNAGNAFTAIRAEKANTELADLRERLNRLRAHCDGLAEKVRGLSVLGYGVETVRRDDVLAIIEGDKP